MSEKESVNGVASGSEIYCKKCGSTISENDKFCGKCGEKVSGIDSSAFLKEPIKKAKKGIRKLLSCKAVILVSGFIVAIIFCLVKLPSWNFISGVKSGNYEYYPEVTMGDAFENWFASPKWSYNSESKLVVFTGGCTFDGKPATAAMSFRVYENGSFELDSISVEDKYNMEYLTENQCLNLYIEIFDNAYKERGLEPPSELKDARNAAYLLDWIFN